MNYRILLSGGGTTGSVTPLLALASEIQRRRSDVEFLFVGTKTGPEKKLVEASHIPFKSIDSGKFRRYMSPKNISDVWKIWQGYKQAKIIIEDWKPHVAITAGSFVSVPIMKAAQRAGVKTIIHQQDVQPGLANTLMASKATVVTTTFEISLRAFPKNKSFWIGNPVRPEIVDGSAERAKRTFHLTEKLPILLVLGGGTGSTKLNVSMAKLADQLTKNWYVIHLTGAERKKIISHNPRYITIPFLTTEFPDLLAAAEMVISRAGLGAISELAAVGKATIFIPMPDTHQESNAKVISQAQAGIVLDQGENIEQKILAAIENLQQNSDEAQRLGANLKQFYAPGALSKLADQALALLPV